MQRRRIRLQRQTGLGPVLVVGLGLGLATGFLLGELYGGNARGTLKRALRPLRRLASAPRTIVDLTADLQQALDQALGLDARSLELVRVGKHTIELHGWVGSRAARSRALRTARAVVAPDIRLIDGLLVWGEDDVAPGPSPLPEESETA
jgi:hypothetical protein